MDAPHHTTRLANRNRGIFAPHPCLTGMRVLLLALLSATVSAAPLEFSSGSSRTHLLELFTSEGCSSCPPAEQWLVDLQHAPGLWRDFVPLAWHVDYWDRLGWKDRFATRGATARQHTYASLWRARTVYTPCVVLNGHESSQTAAPPRATAAATGTLRAAYDVSTGKLRATFAPSSTTAPPVAYDVHAAFLGTNLTSQVTAGENRGRTLRHGFVVRVHATAPLRHDSAELTVTPPAADANLRPALAIWITPRDELTPLQATGGWLKN